MSNGANTQSQDKKSYEEYYAKIEDFHQHESHHFSKTLLTLSSSGVAVLLVALPSLFALQNLDTFSKLLWILGIIAFGLVSCFMLWSAYLTNLLSFEKGAWWRAIHDNDEPTKTKLENRHDILDTLSEKLERYSAIIFTFGIALLVVLVSYQVLKYEPSNGATNHTNSMRCSYAEEKGRKKEGVKESSYQEKGYQEESNKEKSSQESNQEKGYQEESNKEKSSQEGSQEKGYQEESNKEASSQKSN